MRRTDDVGFKIETAKCLGQTDKAIKVEAPAFDAPTWIPKSQVHDDSEVYDGDDGGEGTLIVTTWWAKKQGWVDD